MTKRCPIITIDGPGGTGKGTVCHIIAKRLNWHLLDSGVLYRALAMAAVKHGIAYTNEESLAVLAGHLDIQFLAKDVSSPPEILLEGEDITTAIRTEEWGNGASQVGAFAKVRTALLARQRAFACPPGLVTDGRDMGTIIFPHAELKIFLGASCEERAKRRFLQLKQKGIDANLSGLIEELTMRDIRDSQRAVAPLKPAADAIIIDTTQLSVAEVVDVVMAEVVRLGLGT